MYYKDPAKDHSHYGPKVRDALYAFQDVWKAYFNKTWIAFKQENAFQLDTVQSAWDALAKARMEETGTAFYLSKTEYNRVNSSGSPDSGSSDEESSDPTIQ